MKTFCTILKDLGCLTLFSLGVSLLVTAGGVTLGLLAVTVAAVLFFAE